MQILRREADHNAASARVLAYWGAGIRLVHPGDRVPFGNRSAVETADPMATLCVARSSCRSLPSVLIQDPSQNQLRAVGAGQDLLNLGSRCGLARRGSGQSAAGTTLQRLGPNDTPHVYASST